MKDWKMNSDKLKALKEKLAAEKMMLNEEYVSARDKLLIAKQLYPTIDNIDSMVTVCDILILAAGLKLSDSDIDDCWVLEYLLPFVTETDLGFHYQKLLTSLQPIRDEFPGTELALQFLQNAFSKFSGQEKHSKCHFKHDTSLAGHHVFKCHKVSSSQNLDIGSGEVSMDLTSGKGSHFEPYLLPCHNINEQGVIITHQAALALKKPNQEFYNFENNRKVEFFRAGQIWVAHFQAIVPRNYRYALINSNDNLDLCVTWLKPIPVSPSEERWYLAGLPVGCGSFDLNSETNDVVRPMIFSHKCSPFHALTKNQIEIYPKKGEIWALHKNWNPDECAYNPESLKGGKFNLVEVLSDFSKFSGVNVVCLTKLDGFRSVFQRETVGRNPIICQIPSNNLQIFSHNIPAYRLMGGDGEKVNVIFELDQLALSDDLVNGIDPPIILNKKINDSSRWTPLTQLPASGSHAKSKFLKLTWSPNDFAVGQVWAVYSGKDSLPRRYFQINSVISEKQASVTFLEPHPVIRGDIEWKEKNLPISCGVFELCKTSVILELSQFSHSIQPQRSLTEPHFIIYPKKGQVWAMYKNWNNEWNQNDYRNCECSIVEILSELSNENGMRVAKLVKVENNVTFFQRQQCDGFDIVRIVSQAEMLSFSHQIPAFKVHGIETYGIPKDSWHLDPNALIQ